MTGVFLMSGKGWHPPDVFQVRFWYFGANTKDDTVTGVFLMSGNGWHLRGCLPSDNLVFWGKYLG